MMLHIYQELADKSRRALLSELRTGAKTVSDLVQATGMKQPNVSNHLARLRAKGLVRTTKVGRQVFYALATPDVELAVHRTQQVAEPEPEPQDMAELAKDYAKIAIQGDEAGCFTIVDSLFRRDISIIDIYQDFLAEAMSMVGVWYKVGAIDEGQEHMASEITKRVVGRVLQFRAPTSKVNRTALLGCAPGNRHVIGLRMLADFLRFHGWETRFLGADVPAKAFIGAVQQHRPDLVLVSITVEEGLATSLQLIESLAKLKSGKPGFTLGVGGLAVRNDSSRFLIAGADFACSDLRLFAEQILPDLHGARRSERATS